MNVVDPGVFVLGSKRNVCSPTNAPYNPEPRHLKAPGEFSCGAELVTGDQVIVIRRVNEEDMDALGQSD